jgi:hypothetical protein
MSDARTLVPINYEWRGEVTNAEMNALHAEAFESRVARGANGYTSTSRNICAPSTSTLAGSPRRMGGLIEL